MTEKCKECNGSGQILQDDGSDSTGTMIECDVCAPEPGELFYVWIDADGKAITKAWSYKESIELDAEQESPPTGAFSLRTGDKKELQAMYGLDESDFVGESGELLASKEESYKQKYLLLSAQYCREIDECDDLLKLIHDDLKMRADENGVINISDFIWQRLRTYVEK